LEELQLTQVAPNTKRDSILDLDETHGTLLEDLSADSSILLLDFKPKWLSQSPTAPKTANTCRTCALRRLRRKQPKSHPRFCPLDLSSSAPPRVLRAVTAFLAEKGIHNPTLAEQITQHLLNSKLIPTLLAAQTSPTSSLATKMTLRDCTLFVQIPRELIPDPQLIPEAMYTSHSDAPPGEPPGEAIGPPGRIAQTNGTAGREAKEERDGPPAATHGFLGEAEYSSDAEHVNTPNSTSSIAHTRRIRIVIADLDEKSEINRGEYWRSLEDQLIQGGYYLGKGKQPPYAEDCDLSAVT